MKKTYIIAEIGINHNGDLDIAKKLIDIAVVAGCDAVKFQKRNPDVCVPEHQKSVMRKTPWGEMTYLEYKYRMEFDKDQYDEIDEYCRSKNIAWSASPWDLDSLEFLKQYDIPFVKIPSAMITNEELMKATAEFGKKVIISTGMSTEEEIDQAVEWLKDTDLSILHCNSTYPAPLEDLNLSYIPVLKEKYGREVGYSGHEMWGSDHLGSVEPQGLIKLCNGIRELESAYGDGIKVVTEGEKPIRKKLRGN